MAPAFVDSHVHTTETGLAVTGLDLREARTLAEALDAVERAARHCGGRPVLGGGWNDADWPEGRAPTAAELDRASYGGVVYLARVDIHSAVVSSALMAAVPGLPGLDGYRADGWMREPDCPRCGAPGRERGPDPGPAAATRSGPRCGGRRRWASPRSMRWRGR